MENLNKVPSSGTTFGNVVESINANFGLILTAITELEQTNKRKYLFTNEAELKATYPNPDKGDYAFVGELANAIVYKCNTAGTWTNTGEKWNVGGTIDVTAYVSPSDPISDLTQLVANKVRMLRYLTGWYQQGTRRQYQRTCQADDRSFQHSRGRWHY